MNKMLGIAIVALLATGLVIGGAAAMQPDTYHIERSVDVAAPVADVYGMMTNLNRFPEWSPWERLDPAMKRTITGAPATIGATFAWEGNDQVGAGLMTVTDVKPGQSMTMDLEFLRPFPATSVIIWSLQETPGGTRATWAMDGKNKGLKAKVSALFLDMDGLIGKDFAAGLTRVKVIAEKKG